MSENFSPYFEKVSDKDKIRVLERILQNILGWLGAEEEISYHRMGDTVFVRIEIDPDKIAKWINDLTYDDIDVSFTNYVRMTEIVPGEDKEPEAYTVADIAVHPRYWEVANNLKKELKKLKAENTRLKRKLKKLEENISSKTAQETLSSRNQKIMDALVQEALEDLSKEEQP